MPICSDCADYTDGICGQDWTEVDGDNVLCSVHSDLRPPGLRLAVPGDVSCVRCASWCRRREQCRLPLGIFATKDMTCLKARRK